MDRELADPSCGFKQRIIQIHPTLRCNLLCTHCYSSSGPSANLSLSPETVCKALSDAVQMGYSVASFSGGEPLIYEGLFQVLAHARSCGMRTTVTTNGTLFSEGRLSRLQGLVDLLAISLDGPPDLHNQVRNSPYAFNRLLAGLKRLQGTGIKFGFIHTLTRRSWEHLLWLAEFASEQGAALLQIHPLELVGRAEQLMPQYWPEDDTLAKVYLLTLALSAKYEGRLTIQLDLLHRDYLLEHPELVYATGFHAASTNETPAELVSPLVVEADGTVVPLCYGFSHDYAICNLNREVLAAEWPGYLQEGYLAFRWLCRAVFEELAAPRELPFLNWYELIVVRSRTLVSGLHLAGSLPGKLL